MEILLWTMVVIDTVGLGGLVYWLGRQIGALNATVAAQRQTIETIGQVNATVLEVFRAMDPERWAREVTVHKQLADEKLDALLEKKGRELEQRTAEAQTQAARYLRAFIHVLLQWIPFIPKERRIAEIAALGLPDDINDVLHEFAKKSPDRSDQFGLGALARLAMVQATADDATIDTRPPPRRADAT